MYEHSENLQVKAQPYWTSQAYGMHMKQAGFRCVHLESVSTGVHQVSCTQHSLFFE